MQRIIRDRAPWILCGYLILQPFLDIITAFQVTGGWDSGWSVGQLVRGLFLVFALVALWMDARWRVVLNIVAGFCVLYIVNCFLNSGGHLAADLVMLIKVFYLPMLVALVFVYGSGLLFEKLGLYLLLTYLALAVVPGLLGINFVAPEIYDGKVWNLGLFYAGNDLTAIILALAPGVITSLVKQKRWWWLAGIVAELAVATVMIGTKAIIIGMVIMAGFFLIRMWRKMPKKHRWGVGVGAIIVLVGGVIMLPMTPVYKNTMIALEYHGVNSPADLISYDKMDKVVFSERLTYTGRLLGEYGKAPVSSQWFGMGAVESREIKTAEIDVMDIFAAVGIVGMMTYGAVMIMVWRRVKVAVVRSEQKFALVFLGMMALVVGHVLIAPAVATAAAMLFAPSDQKC